jgi:hypothetical protein
MGISVSVVVTVATEAYDRPIVAPSYAIPVAALSYIVLVIDARVDTTGRYKLLRDSSVVLDKAVLSVGKVLKTSTLGVSDEKTVAFTKARTDAVTMSDVFTRTLVTIRNFYESLSPTDFKKFTVGKVLNDSTTTSEVFNRMVGKVLRDGVAMNDAFDATDGSTYVFTKSVMNMAFVNEQLVKTLSRPFADSATATEAKAFSLDKPLADSFSTQEALSFSTALTKADAATAADRPFKSFTRAPFSDTATAGDAFSLQPGKYLADNLGTGDTGSLRSQGYCDFSYFAEDYVGDSRTF